MSDVSKVRVIHSKSIEEIKKDLESNFDYNLELLNKQGFNLMFFIEHSKEITESMFYKIMDSYGYTWELATELRSHCGEYLDLDKWSPKQVGIIIAARKEGYKIEHLDPNKWNNLMLGLQYLALKDGLDLTIK